MRLPLLCLTGVLSLVAPSASRAQTPQSAVAPNPAPPAARNTLRGRVTDTAGNPIADAEVRLVELKRYAITDSDGRYVVDGLPPGAYQVAIQRLGFAPALVRITLAGDQMLDQRLKESLVEIAPIQVTASATATTALTSPQPLSTLTGEELQKNAAPSLGATLESMPGLRNYSTGAAIGKPVIRGLGSDRVLVLTDGVRNDSQGWGDEHSPNVETSDLDRVEVIRGPASVLYGSDALGGVINLIPHDLPTAFNESPFLNVRARAATASVNHNREGTLHLEGAARGLGFRGSITGRNSDDIATPAGLLSNSGYHAGNGEAAIGLRGGWGAVDVHGLSRTERIQIHEDPAEDPGATPYQRVTTRSGGVKLQLPLGPKQRVTVSGDYQENDRREYETATAEDVALGLGAKNWLGSARYHHAPVGRFTGVVGASFVRNQFEKSGEESLIPNSRAIDVAAFLLEETERGPWRFSIGARLDHRSLDVQDDLDLGVTAQTREYDAVSGDLGALLRVSDPVAIVANVGRGFRAPSTFELFSNGVHEGTVQYDIGDPALDVETSLNADLALRVQSATLRAEAGAYLNLVRNFIYAQPTGVTDPGSGFEIFQYTQGDARLMGVEASADYHPVPLLHLHGAVDLTHGDNLDLDQPLPRIPPLRATAGVHLEGADRGWLRSPYVLFDIEYDLKQTRLAPNDFAPPPYALADAGAGAAFGFEGLTLSLDVLVKNLFDREYASFLSRYKTYAAAAGRDVQVRLGMEF